MCDRLLAEGFEVVAIDNFITGSERNIAHLMGAPRFEFIHQDVSAPFDVEGEVTHVLHMASPAAPRIIWSFPSRRSTWVRQARATCWN